MMKKRILAAILSTAMIFTQAPAVYADEEVQTENEAAVTVESSSVLLESETEAASENEDIADAVNAEETAKESADIAEEEAEENADIVEEAAEESADIAEEAAEENADCIAEDTENGITAEIQNTGSDVEKISEEVVEDEKAEENSEEASREEISEEDSEEASQKEISEEDSEETAEETAEETSDEEAGIAAEAVPEETAEDEVSNESAEEICEQPADNAGDETADEMTDKNGEDEEQISVLSETAFPVISSVSYDENDRIVCTFSSAQSGYYYLYTRENSTDAWQKQVGLISISSDKTAVISLCRNTAKVLNFVIVPQSADVAYAPSTAMCSLVWPKYMDNFGCYQQKTGVEISISDFYGNDAVNIYRKKSTEADSAYVKIASVSSTVSRYLDKSAASGVTYDYCIAGVYKGKTAAKSPAKTVYYLKTPLFTKVSQTDGGFKIAWQKVGGAAKYILSVKLGTYQNYTIEFNANTTSNVFKCSSGQNFSFTIMARSSDGKYSYSDELSDVWIPGNPTLRMKKATTSSITLTWNYNYYADGYILYRYNKSTKKYKKYKTITKNTTTSAAIKKLQADTGYTFLIKSYHKTSAGTLYSKSYHITAYTDQTAAQIKKANKAKTSVKTTSSIVSKKKNYLRTLKKGNTTWYLELNNKSFIDQKGRYNVVYERENYIYIKRYSAGSLKLLKSIRIKKKYSLYGGIACDASGNIYIAWGQSDTTENGTKKTFAISKYSYAGKHVKTTAFKGKDLDVKTPFSAGDCSIAISGNTLVCSFAALMYKKNGINHQYTNVVTLNTKTMKASSANSYQNYVSHSFDQEVIITANGRAVFADQGDAYPRGLVLTESEKGMQIVTSRRIVASFYGSSSVYGQIGGIAEVSSGYVFVGTVGKKMTKKQFNNYQVFMSITAPSTNGSSISGSSRTGTSQGEQTTDTGLVWITDYKDGSVAKNVRSVKLDKDRIFITWERYSKAGVYKKTYYTIYSAEGKQLLKTRTLKGVRLNDCNELSYKNGYVYWSQVNSAGNGFKLFKIKV